VCFGELKLYGVAAMDIGAEVGDSLSEYWLPTECWQALGNHIDRRIVGVRHTFSWPIGLVVNCPDLLTALYWQFACLMSGKRQAGLCKRCGARFEKRRRDHLYCGSNCRSQESRSRKKG